MNTMKNVFMMCLLMLLGGTLMAQNFVIPRTKVEPDIPGFGGTVIVCSNNYIDYDGKPKWEFAGVPYAQICLVVDGKDTVRLTCDALGNYLWKTDKVPETLEYYITTAGFEKCMFPHKDRYKGVNWKTLQIPCKRNLPWNRINISVNKVEVTTIRDTITYPVENVFKTLEGDFIGDLLRGLPGFAMENGFLTLNGQPIHYIELNDYKSYKEFAKLTEANIKRRVEQEKEARKKGETQ